MAASYPGSLKSFTNKTNKVDLVDAAHVNDLQNEVVAIETELGVDVAGSATDLVTRLAIMIADSGAVRQGTGFPGSPIEGQLFYRTDEDILYIRDGSSNWDAVSFTGAAAGGDLTGTYPNPTIGANKVLASYISTSFMGCFSKNVAEETNTLILAGTLTNKWIIYQGYFRAAGAGAYIPGGANDAQTLGESFRGAGDGSTPVITAAGPGIADLLTDSHSVFTGRFYSESGVTAPTGTASHDPALAHGMCAESTDVTNEFDTDCFLYVDSTSSDLMLHIGTIAPGTANVDFSIFVTILPDTSL